MVGRVAPCGNWSGSGSGAPFGQSAPQGAVVTGLALSPTSPVKKPWVPAGSQTCSWFKECPQGQTCQTAPGGGKACGTAPPPVPGGCQILGFFWTDAQTLADYASGKTQTRPAPSWQPLIGGALADSVQVHAPNDSALSRVEISARAEDGACCQIRLYSRAFRHLAGSDSPFGGAYPPQATPGQTAARSLGCSSGQPTTYISGMRGWLAPKGTEPPPR